MLKYELQCKIYDITLNNYKYFTYMLIYNLKRKSLIYTVRQNH